MRKWISLRSLMSFVSLFCIAALALAQPEPAPRPPLDRAASPGRLVRVAAIPIGSGGEAKAKLELGLSHLETAGRQGVDLAVLPEIFAGQGLEKIPGPTTNAVAALARKYKMWVVCPVYEDAGDRQYNTAVLIDRSGAVAGCYRKVFVFWGEGKHAGDTVGVFDTDFGRVAMLTCFDANFDEVWQEAERKGAEMVLWPSAYGGGVPLKGYAMIHNLWIVPVGFGNIIDIFGREVECERPRDKQFIATLDLDLTIVHKDFNRQKIEKLLKEHAGEVERIMPEVGDASGWYILRAVKPGVCVRDLCKKYEIETLREYRHRSREQINQRRKNGEKI